MEIKKAAKLYSIRRSIQLQHFPHQSVIVTAFDVEQSALDSHRLVICTYVTHSGNGHFLACSPSWWKKLAQAGEGGGWGCTATPFHCIYHHVQSCGVCSSWEGRYPPPICTELCDNSAAWAYRHSLSNAGTAIYLFFFSLFLYATSSLCPYTGNLSERRK